MASTDTTNDAVIERTVSDPNFQARCYRRFLAAAISDMNETVQATTSAQSASGATSLTFAVTISAATTVIVASGDIILFSPPSHVARAQLAGALFNGVLSLRTLAMLILANATNQANCLADASVAGGAILDSDIDFQINSIFTGIATSHGW
jgi:hypothetical protein